MATIIALVAFVTYVNFFPIARRGGNYWLVIMVRLNCLIRKQRRV